MTIFNFNKQAKCTQCGRSMIEMLGVLAIIGVLSVGGIAGYSKAMMQYKINKTADQISHTISNIRTLYAQQTNYVGLSEAANREDGIIYPGEYTTDISNMIDGGGVKGYGMLNPFNGGIRVTELWDYPDLKAYSVSISGLPKEACVFLATQNWGSSFSSELVAMGVNSYYLSGAEFYLYEDNDSNALNCNDGHSFCAKDFPVSVNKIIDACNCGSENTCAIFWVLK